MGSGLKIFIPLDDGSIDSLKAKLKAVRADAKAAKSEMQDLQKTGQQVSREVMEKVDKAKQQLQIVSREYKDARGDLVSGRHSLHEAHTTERLAHKAEHLLTNRVTQALMSGGRIGGKDIAHEVLQSGRLAQNIAKQLGASEKFMQTLGMLGVYGMAASAAVALGSEIASNVKEAGDMRSRLLNKKAGGEKLREMFEGTGGGVGRGIEEALGLSGARGRREAVENAEKFAAALEGLNADDISGAMTASRRGYHTRSLKDLRFRELFGGEGDNSQWYDKTALEKDVLTQKDRRVGQEMAIALRQAEAKRREQLGQELTKEQLAEVFQSVTVDFMKRGEISGKEFDQLEKAHQKPGKIKNVNDLYDERLKKEVFEANLAAHERRVPWNVMD